MRRILFALVILLSQQINAQYPEGVRVEKSQEVAYIVDSVPYYQDLWTVYKNDVVAGYVRNSETMDSEVKGKYDASTLEFMHPFDFFETIELAVKWIIKEYDASIPVQPVANQVVTQSGGMYTEFADNNLKIKFTIPSNWVIQSIQYMPEITGEKQADGTVKVDISKMRSNASDYNSINFIREGSKELMIGIQADKEKSLSDKERINNISQVMAGYKVKISGTGEINLNGIKFLWIEFSDFWGKRKLYTTVANGNRYYFTSGIGFSPELATQIEEGVMKVLGSLSFQ